MTDLLQKVTDWLKDSGYSLEMAVAQRLQDAGFDVAQSEYVRDSETGKWRETDVVAYAEHDGATCRGIFSFLIECKGGGMDPKPWVLFTTANRSYPASLAITRRATTQIGESILTALSHDPSIQSSRLFEMSPRPGYGLAVAFKKQNEPDPTFDALNSVCKATLAIVKRHGDVADDMLVPFGWPIIVINQSLFEGYLGADGVLQVQKTAKGVLIWRNPLIARHTIVQIYTKDQFLAEAADLHAAAAAFLSRVCEENDRAPRTPQSRSAS